MPTALRLMGVLMMIVCLYWLIQAVGFAFDTTPIHTGPGEPYAGSQIANPSAMYAAIGYSIEFLASALISFGTAMVIEKVNAIERMLAPTQTPREQTVK